MSRGLFSLLAAFSVAVPLSAQPLAIEFEPRVGATGARVVVKNPPPAGAELRLGKRVLPVLEETPGEWSFVVPPGSETSYLEYVKSGRVVGRSALPFVVTDPPHVEAPRLIGLKEAVSVFAYAEPIPQSEEKPKAWRRPLLVFEDEDFTLTLGESAPDFLTPAVQHGDLASQATRSMSGSLFLFTLRGRTKKLRLKVPPPVPTPIPAESGRD